MQNNPSIKKNYILNLAYQVLAVCVPIITTPYVSRILMADGIGAYSYTLSIATYFSMFAALGISTYGQLEISKHRDSCQQRSKLFFEIIAARLFMAALMLIIYALLSKPLGTYQILYRIMAIYIVADTIDISWFFQGLEEFRVIVLRSCVIKVLSTLCIFIFVKQKDDLALYALILQGSALTGNILLWPYLKNYLCRIDLHKIRFYRHWKDSLVYFIPTVATSVYTVLDKSMIGFFTKSSLQNGYYEQAHKIEQILLVFLTSLGTVTLPRLVYLWKNGDKNSLNKIMDRTISFILLISFPMMFGISAVADKLIPLFLGDGYEECIVLLRIFSVLLVIVGLDNIIGKQCLVATGRQKQFNIGVILGAIVNFMANLFLINRFGAKGAAVGSVVAEITILSTFIYFSKNIYDFSNLKYSFIKYGIAGAIMGIITWIVGTHLSVTVIGLLIQIIIGMIVYFLILTISKDPIINAVFVKIKQDRN